MPKPKKAKIIDINKYKLTPKIIRSLKVNRDKLQDRELIEKLDLWRNNVIKAWCTGAAFGPWFDSTEIWIGIHDEPEKEGAPEVEFHFWILGGMCELKVDRFFSKNDIKTEDDYKIQKLFMEKMNELIDAGLLSLPEKGQ